MTNHPNRGWCSRWSVDLNTSTATHRDGWVFKFSLANDGMVDGECIAHPKPFTTVQAVRLTQEACQIFQEIAWMNNKGNTIEHLIRGYAMGLIKVQNQLDTGQIPTACFQGALQDCFDTASYLNIFGSGGQVWPIDIGELVEQGEKPLRTWISPWPKFLDEKLGHESLIKDGRPSHACHELASITPALPYRMKAVRFHGWLVTKWPFPEL